MSAAARLCTIIRTISSTASTKEKVKLLEQYQNEPHLFELLKLNLDPFQQFYVDKLPIKHIPTIGYPLRGKDLFEQFYHLTKLLKERTITGHVALATIEDFFNQCEKDEHWLFKTILLKEPLNFGTTLVNRVRPKFIPEFDLMLADSKQAKLDEITFPIAVQTKLDGFRAVYFPSTGIFLGRNGKPLKNRKLSAFFADLIKLNKSLVLDGELYSDTLNFNQIASALNSENGDLSQIFYCVYDIMEEGDWVNQKCSDKYIHRWDNLRALIEVEWNLDNVRIVPGFVANNVAQVEEYYKEVLAEGYEGLMLKSLTGLYNWKRVTLKSQIMMKLKPTSELDAKIIGFEEGTGKNIRSLGALVVRVDEIKNDVKVGSGFTEEERAEYWNNKDKLLGQWIRMKAFEITEGNESVRFPIFLSIRDSKD